MKKKLEVNLEIGRVYGVYYWNIRNVFFEDLNLQEISFRKNGGGSEILLVKYLGDGKFLEYYSGFVLEGIEYESMVYQSKTEFYDGCLKFIKEPLKIFVGDLIDLSNIQVNEFVKTLKMESSVNESLNKRKEIVIEDLKSKLDYFIKKDYDYAYLDNCVFDLTNDVTYVCKKLYRRKLV